MCRGRVSLTGIAKRIKGKRYIRHRSGCKCCRGQLWVLDKYIIVVPVVKPVTIEVPAELKLIPRKPTPKWVIRFDSLTPLQSALYKLVAKYPGKNYLQLQAKSGYRLNLGSLTVLLTVMYQAGVFTRTMTNRSYKYFVNSKVKVRLDGSSQIPT